MVSQKLGHTFKVFYQVPHQGEVAPMTSSGATATFPAIIVTPPQVAQEIKRSGTLLANSFGALSDKSKPSSVHCASGLMLSSNDMDDIFAAVNDGDKWFIQNKSL